MATPLHANMASVKLPKSSSVIKVLGLCVVAACAGCSTTTTHWDHGKFAIRDNNVKNFVVTNNKHPSENFAVVVHRHEAGINLHYDF